MFDSCQGQLRKPPAFAKIPFMEEKDRELLRATLKLAEENNRILAKLYRSWWWSRAWKWFYWLVIVGVALGAFYFLQPYVDRLKQLYYSSESQLENVRPK